MVVDSVVVLSVVVSEDEVVVVVDSSVVVVTSSVVVVISSVVVVVDSVVVVVVSSVVVVVSPITVMSCVSTCAPHVAVTMTLPAFYAVRVAESPLPLTSRTSGSEEVKM